MAGTVGYYCCCLNVVTADDWSEILVKICCWFHPVLVVSLGLPVTGPNGTDEQEGEEQEEEEEETGSHEESRWVKRPLLI